MDITMELTMIAKARESDLNDDGHIISQGVAEIERLRIENIQLKFACGYPRPADLEKHILPSNPFQCGICAARNQST